MVMPIYVFVMQALYLQCMLGPRAFTGRHVDQTMDPVLVQYPSKSLLPTMGLSTRLALPDTLAPMEK